MTRNGKLQKIWWNSSNQKSYFAFKYINQWNTTNAEHVLGLVYKP